MTKPEIAKKLLKILKKYVPDPKPLLDFKDYYTFLVAIILSAQCTDLRVNKITPLLFAKADNPKDMIQLDVDEIREIIRPCGLAPRKAKAIWEMSKILVDKYKGKVPRTFEELEELPGVGHKTASVIMYQAFHKPAFAVDTHVIRCANRWGLSHSKDPKRIEKDMKELFPQNEWGATALRMTIFAREHCKAVHRNPEKCPVCSWILKT